MIYHANVEKTSKLTDLETKRGRGEEGGGDCGLLI